MNFCLIGVFERELSEGLVQKKNGELISERMKSLEVQFEKRTRGVGDQVTCIHSAQSSTSTDWNMLEYESRGTLLRESPVYQSRRGWNNTDPISEFSQSVFEGDALKWADCCARTERRFQRVIDYLVRSHGLAVDSIECEKRMQEEVHIGKERQLIERINSMESALLERERITQEFSEQFTNGPVVHHAKHAAVQTEKDVISVLDREILENEWMERCVHAREELDRSRRMEELQIQEAAAQEQLFVRELSDLREIADELDLRNLDLTRRLAESEEAYERQANFFESSMCSAAEAFRREVNEIHEKHRQELAREMGERDLTLDELTVTATAMAAEIRQLKSEHNFQGQAALHAMETKYESARAEVSLRDAEIISLRARRVSLTNENERLLQTASLNAENMALIQTLRSRNDCLKRENEKLLLVNEDLRREHEGRRPRLKELNSLF